MKLKLIGALMIVIGVIVIFLGVRSYVEERLKSAEETLNQQYELKLNTLKQQLLRSKLERDSITDLNRDQYIHIKNLERLDSINRTKPIKTYSELKNKELENKMLEVYKQNQ